VDTVKYIAEDYTAHGYAGGNYKNDKELYAAIKNDSYNGEWFIPPREFLDGKDVNGREITPNNLLAYKDKNGFKGSFKMNGFGIADWYWSSTDHHRDGPFSVWSFRLYDGCVSSDHKDNNRLSCRPVRLEPAL